MRKIFKKVTAAIIASVTVCTFAINAGAYTYSWSLRQIHYAPTSENNYRVVNTATNALPSVIINCNTESGLSVDKAWIYVIINVNGDGVASDNLYKAGDNCSYNVGKIGQIVTNTAILHCPKTSGTYQATGVFAG